MINPLIFGIASTELSKDEINFFVDNPCFGFILFARNITSKNQLILLTTSLKNLYPNREVPILVDQEGGRVARIKPSIGKKLYPAASYFSTLYDNNKSLAKSELHANYAELMFELKSLGIDSPCAPVCDLFFDDASNIIGDRSFGSTSEKVIDLCKSAIDGILESNGLPFIKHIPGHGRAKLDSHSELPVIDTKLDELINTDFMIFRELSSSFEGTIFAMTAHVIYSCLDTKRPVTISKKSIEYIRNDIGFKGTLVSDDICMHALHVEITHKESLNKYFLENLAKVTKMSLDAGCDIVLHCSGNINEMRAVATALD